MQNPGYSRTDSAYSDKPTPGVMGAGAAAGTGAGAGVGAGAAAGAIYNNPFSDSAPQMAQTGRPQSNAMAYQNIPSEQYWSNDGGAGGAQAGGYDSAPKSRKKWWIIGGVVAAVVVIAAVVGGVVGSRKSGNGASGGSSGSAGSGSSGSSAGGDASNFDKNPNLHNSFWGFAYTPQVCGLAVSDLCDLGEAGVDN